MLLMYLFSELSHFYEYSTYQLYRKWVWLSSDFIHFPVYEEVLERFFSENSVIIALVVRYAH